MKKSTMLLILSTLLIPASISSAASEVKKDLNTSVLTDSKSSTSKSISSGDNSDITISADAKAEATAIVSSGRKGSLSAYGISSIQGEYGSTYIPNLDSLRNNEGLFEYKNAALTETRFFNKSNLNDSFLTNSGKKSLEYTEAINWLYKNNLLHAFGNLTVNNSINGEDRYDNGGILNHILEQSGGYTESVKFLVLDKGTYSINMSFGDANNPDYTDSSGDKKYYPDQMIVTKDGQQLLDTGMVTGSQTKTITIDENGTTINITMNKGGNSNKNTSWSYYITGLQNYSNKYLGQNYIDYRETGHDAYFSRSGNTFNSIKRKDFVMELMKIAGGVIESRPMTIQNRYLLQDDIGTTRYETDTLPILSTPFKKQSGALGIDPFINDVNVDFKQYGLDYAYINPNVYELYFKKALESEIISKDDLIQNYQSSLTADNPRWSNKLPIIRVNHTGFNLNNNGKASPLQDSQIFGDSYEYKDSLGQPDPADTFDESTKYQSFTINYNPNTEYFTKPNISYLEAVDMIYKATVAFSDDKLTDKEVQSIVSMYGVNYSSLTEEQRVPVNYLIANGIIDGTAAAKFTSTSPITTEDALVMLYRYANKSARLTFKTNFSFVDQEMLTKGMVQSSAKIIPLKDSPDLQVNIKGGTDSVFYVLMNNSLREAEIKEGTVPYQLGPERNNIFQSSEIKQESPIYVQVDDNSILPDIKPFELDGKKYYEIRKYSVPTNVSIKSLGLTVNKNYAITHSDWVSINTFGGFYTIADSSIDNSKVGDSLSFTQTLLSSLYSNPKIQFLYQKYNDESSKIAEKQAFKQKTLKQKVSYLFGKLFLALTGKPTTAYAEETEQQFIDVSVIINKSAKSNIKLDGNYLFVCQNANDDRSSCDMKLNEEITDTSISYGQDFPETGQRELIFKVLKVEGIDPSTARDRLRSRLWLDGKGISNNMDIAAYMGLQTGQTMISISELSSFGIEVQKEVPDILHKMDRTGSGTSIDTGMYAYLNQEQSYALIGNTIKRYPKDTVMIKLSGGEIYYNVQIVMSMLSEKDFYLFNDSGRLQIIKKLDGLSYEDVYKPKTFESVSHALVADNKINISSIAGPANSFFMVFDDVNKYKRIYGFQPYYDTDIVETTSTSKKVDDIIKDMSSKDYSLTELDNMIINNAAATMEFGSSKDSKFVLTDSAMRVTQLVDSDDSEALAGAYLDYITSLASNINTNNMSQLSGVSSFDFAKFLKKLEDGGKFSSSSMQSNSYSHYRKGVDNASTLKQFLTLYLLNKFKVEGVPDESAFYNSLLLKFNSMYSENGFSVQSVDDLTSIKFVETSTSDIHNKRTFTFKLMTNDNGVLTSGGALTVERNGAVYLSIQSKDSPNAPYIEDIFGTYFYRDANSGLILYNPNIQYKSLPTDRTPLEALKNGSKISIAGEPYTVINNSDLYQTSDGTILLVKLISNNLYFSDGQSRESFLKSEKDRIDAAIPNFSKVIYNLPPDTGDNREQAYADLLSPEDIRYFRDSLNTTVAKFNFNAPTDFSDLTKNYAVKVFNGATEGWFTVEPKRISDEFKPSDLSEPIGLFLSPNDSLKATLSNSDSDLSYKSLLINAGSVTVDSDGNAYLEPRNSNFMSTRAPLTDVVNEIVKAIKINRSESSVKKIGDIPDKDILEVGDLKLIRSKNSANSDMGKYASFITTSLVNDGNTTITKKELLYDKSLIVRNFSWLESTKVPLGMDSNKPLYQLIGNLSLNLLQEDTVKQYGDLLGIKSIPFMIENRSNGGEASLGIYKPKMALLQGLIGNDKWEGGEFISAITTDQRYPYYLNLQMDPNLEVFQGDDKVWRISGYSRDNQINIQAFQSRISRFDGIFANNVIMLPTAANVEGGLLGFLLSKFQMDRMKDVLDLKYWSDSARRVVLEAESVLPLIGIWYLYLLLVISYSGKSSLVSIFYKRVIDPVRILTFNRRDHETINTVNLTVRVFVVTILLSLFYEGYYRKAIAAVLDTVQALAQSMFSHLI